MGSLSSPPKVPAAQQITYIPSPVISTTSVGTPPVKDSKAVAEENAKQAQSSVRKKGLLSRNRGRLGTISTSLNGFLRASNSQSAQKRLLGE